MTISSARGLSNVLRSTLTLVSYYAEERHLDYLLDEVKHSLVRTIIELDKLSETQTDTQPALETGIASAPEWGDTTEAPSSKCA